MPLICYQNTGELEETEREEVPAVRQKAGTKTSEQCWSLEEMGGPVNSPLCLSFMTDAEAQPLTTCEIGGGGGGGNMLNKHI